MKKEQHKFVKEKKKHNINFTFYKFLLFINLFKLNNQITLQKL